MMVNALFFELAAWLGEELEGRRGSCCVSIS